MGVAERYKKRKEEEKTNTLYNGVENRYLQKNAETIGKKISDRVNTWITNNNNYFSNAQNRFSGENNTFRADASDWLTTVQTQNENFRKEAEGIKNALTQYKTIFGEDYVNSVYEALDGNLKEQEKVISAATADLEYWSRWDSEEAWKKDYDAAVAWQKDYDEKMSYDLEAGQAEIDQLQKDREKFFSIAKSYNEGIARAQETMNNLRVENNTLIGRMDSASKAKREQNERIIASCESAINKALAEQAKYNSIVKEIESSISSKSQYHTLAKRTQDGARLAAVSNPESEYYDPNFEKYSKLGDVVSWENVGSSSKEYGGIKVYDDLKAATLVLNENRQGKEIYSENMVTPEPGIVGYFKGLLSLSEYNTENTELVTIFREMEDKELDTLAYYLKKDEENGTNLAAEYVGSLKDTLNARRGKTIAESKNSPASKYLFAVEAGLDQFFEGRDALFSGADYIPPSATQYASGIIRENLAGEEGGATVFGSSWGQIGYDVINTTANMLPSILASAAANAVLPGAGSYVGATFIGMSAAGNAKAEMLNLGYSKEQATTYGIMVGASEALLEKTLGGIPGLKGGDGIFSSIGQKLLGKIDNALARVSITHGGKILKGLAGLAKFGINLTGNALDEALEEGLQTILEPWMAEIATSVDWDAPDIDEVLYSSLLGALSSLGFSAGDTVVGKVGGVVENKVAYNKQVEEYGQSIIDKGGVEDLQASASKISDSRAVTRLANKVAKKVTAKNVGKLAATIQDVTNAKDRSVIISDLENKGLSKKEATKVADFVTKTAQGYEASAEEVAEIEEITNKLPDETDTVDEAEEYSKLLKETEAQTETPAQSTTPTTEQATKVAAQSADLSTTEAVDVEQSAQSTDVATIAEAGGAKAIPVAESATVEERATEGQISAPASVATTEEGPVTLESASKKYGAQAGAMIGTYTEGQDVAKYDAAYSAAYNMGRSGVSLSYAMSSEATAYLSESQRELAHAAGADASSAAAKAQDAANKAKVNGKTGRRKGVVRGDGVSIADLKATFNDTQNTAYKLLTTYAEATGVDIVLYKSNANANGDFEGGQGKFKWSEDTIYIDLNAGLANIKSVNDLAKYTMLRTFAHEFTHFIEKWNPIWYNEFRKVVFDTITERGENVEDLIETKMSQTEGMSYDKASREVVAEAMTDILPDANFVTELATKHRNIFQKLFDMLKDFLADLKAHFNVIKGSPSTREAKALEEQVGEGVKYVENIVKLFDKIAVEAVENYQATVAIEEADPYGLTDEEISAVLAYKSGGSYNLNAKLRDGIALNEYEQKIVNDLDKALEKLPTYKGKVYRNIQFDGFGDKEARAAYVAGHVIGEMISYDAYASASTAVDGYVLESEFVVHHIIQSTTGRNMEGYGNNSESEVLFARDTQYVTDRIEYDQNGIPTIYLTEVAYGQAAVGREQTQGDVSRDNPRKSRSSDAETDKGEVQRLHSQNTEVGEMQPAISERNTVRNSEKQDNLQGVQAEVSLEEREKAYKKKFSQWLKKSGGRYVIHYGGETFLSNGAFGMRATADEIGWARLEFSGTLEETSFPARTATMLDNANTPVTEAPIEGTTENAAVYVFNIDGKQFVYDKKLLSKLDGNLFYMGDFMRSFKLLKAVDADGKVAGFLLPIKFSGEITNTKPSKLKSFSNKVLSQISNQEVNTNGENVDNRETVQQSVSDRQEDPRVLEGLQTEDVSGDVQRGDAVGDVVERGQQTVRNDVQPDAAGVSGRSGLGDRQSRDLRRDDELTPGAEKLHEEVSEQITQQSTEQPKGRNFVIGESLDLPSGEKSRYKANVEAIRLVKRLEAEGRYATEAEQVILSKYVGWGGLANAFDQRKTEWAKEFEELKELLTEEEYASARGSTLNAHFTDISVIKAMYDGLAGLGFNGGRMLEPSSGVGNFVGAMPADMSAKVKSWTMVELDGITGLMAKYLYPNADVRIQGFEKANIPDNYMDVIISNVPFGNYPITDKAYPKKVTSAIHNYFFAKSLDKVRPGGIVMFITSSYTMNAKDSTVRRYIMQRADLLGAIRLPDSAFKGNAGTEVVTDILVLKKRAANTLYAGEDFLEAPWTYLKNESYNGAYINSYFEAHPEMVLGTATMNGGMYRGNSLTYKALEGRGSLADQIREAFSHIKGKMDYPATLSREKTNFATERANKKTKENGLVVRDGKVYQNKGGELVEVNKANGAAERISSMLDIRDAARNLMNYQQQGLNDTEINKARTQLNKVYDAFVKKYGFINTSTNKNAIKDDPDCFSLFALENWNPDTKKATKADIFSKNTIAPNRTVTAAKDVSEGLIVSVNQTGGVDTALIARLTGKAEADVTRELIDSRKAFKNRNGELETAEVYLSGNVRAKLRDAEALVPLDADYKNNVEALKSVMPEDVGYQDIFVNPGTPWIPSSVYSDFAAYMLGSRNTEWRQAVDVTRNADTGNFTVELKDRYLKTNSSNTQKWGTSRRTFLELFDAMLNSKSVVIKDKLDDGSFVVNKDATAAANEKIENIQKEFQEWLWKDENRRGELETLYNEVFNSVVTPKYNGDNLTVNGANALKPLRPHQRNAVQRVISSGGNTLLAHKVGAGKTYEMAAAAMKLRELGLVKKPMFAVPKSLVAQWGNEFIDFFPTAKLLVAEASDFTASNRKVFMNRIANGEYDAVIVSYEQFEKLPMSDDFTRQLYQEQIDSVIAAIEEAKADKGAKALSVKDLEKKRKSLQAKIDKLTDKAKDEDNIDFEALGVDSLFVDEAHNFKNLFYTTSMTNVAGLGNKDGSKRAFDLYTKVRYLQQLNGGRGIVFATATPVMNSMSEMYIMQKYLQPDLLNQLGLSTFDSWAKQFGEVVNGVEIKPSGQGYRVKQSFSRFKNMSELQLLFRNFADVLTDIPGLKIPKMKGGKVNVIVCEPGQFQQDYMKELEKRADNIKNVDPSEDNMLKITSDGRKISYTQRMIDPTLPYEEGCKIFRCADNIIKEYNDSNGVKGTQIVFLDMATPKGKSDNTTETDDLEMDVENAQLYDDLKARLRQGGIPAQEIAFIHDADTDQKKKKLFADVNDGKVRVLIGSTGKMGVGMNAQKRIVAIHHLDAPWRPGDVEQRDGRAFRQGNVNDEVSKYTYVTEGSFDARLWDILDRKQNFINQVMNGESVGRETEDTGEVTLSAAEVKALASGSPMIMEQVELDTAIKKLESLYRAHTSAVRSAKERLSRDTGEVAKLEKQIANGKADIAARKDTYSDEKFLIKIGKSSFSDKKEAGLALMAEATAKANPNGYTAIGSFAGFELRVIKTSEGINGTIVGKQGYAFKTYPTNTTFMINHLVATVESIDEKVKLWQHNLTETQKDIAEQEKLIAEPFAKQAELDQKRARYNEVMEILNPKEEQSLDSVAEDTVQEQSRTYLEEDYEKENGDIRVRGWRYRANDGAGSSRNGAEVGSSQGLRHIQGDQQRRSGESISVSDSEGRSIRPEIAEQLKDSDVVDSDSRPLALYHYTPGMDFLEISVSKDIGFHSGTIEQAIGRSKGNDGRIFRNYYNIKHLLRIRADIGSWKPRGLALRLVSEGYISESEYAEIERIIIEDEVQDYNSPSSIRLREILAFHGYDGIAYPNGVEADGDAYIAFEKEQIITTEILKYEKGKVLPGENVQYQQRSNTLSDREVLSIAAEKLGESGEAMTEAERDALRIFNDRLTKLYTLQEERAEQGRLYREQQFGTSVDREAAAQTLNRMHILDDQIKVANEDILSIENKKVLGDVLKKARSVVEAEERKHGAEILKRYRDRTRNAAAIKKYRERIKADVNELASWVLKPNNKDIVKHIPDVLKNTVIPFLSSIDFTSKQQLRGGEATKADAEFVKRLNALSKALKENIDADGLYSGYNDLPANFMDRLQSFIEDVEKLVKANSGEFVINKMTSEELKELSSVVRILKAYITQINKFHANAMFQHVWEAGDNTIEALSPMQSDDGKANAATNFVFWQQIRPAFAFERFGEGGKAIYDGLRRGQAQLAFNTKKIVEFAEKTYTDKEVKAWEKEIKEIRIGAGTVRMRVADMMSFYELSKQPDSLRHMLGEGMRVATYKAGGKKISDGGHALTEKDIADIVNVLTPRQKEVADALQKFMQEQGGAWGNYVSVKRFGEELFTNEQYFPINSDGRHLQATADEYPTAASLYALLNMSFTKSRNEKANNRIVIYSIFDVFSNHMASMAQYNAMALPVLDALKWFNYQQKTEDADGNKYVKDGVREQMDRVYGVPEETRPGSGRQGYAQTFVLNIIKAFNGTEAQGVPADTMGMNAIRRYNMAQVAYNFRVVVQQPLAITRAALLIDYGSIMRGMTLKPAAIKQNIEEMRKYSGIAAWKALGFYDTNISRGLSDTIKHRSTIGQKIGDIGMWGAETADTLTWAAMWSACKEEVIKKQKLTPKDAGFYEAVTKLFEDVIYKTQVVDSVLTKNEYLRSKGAVARLLGSFMSEPTTTASMLIDAVDKYNADLKRGMSRSQAWEKNKRMIGRTMYVFGVSAAILAAVQAVADAFRDDDDYETFIEKWLEAFGGNLIDEALPINKLPILSDFYDLGKELLSIFGVDTYGNPPQSVVMQWWDSLVNGTQIIYDKITGEDTSYTWYAGIYKLLQAAAGITGLPMATATREFVTAWNNIVGAMAPSLKIKTYDPGDKNEIKYAYMDGYLTFEEAVEKLIEQGLVDNEDEAYFTVSGWEAGDGYSRFDELYEAVRTGADIDKAMQDLISHGYNEKEILSQITSQIGKWYYDEESDYRITKQQAIDLLTKYTDLTSEEITKKVNEWSAVVVTGIKYGEIDDEFVAGNITAARAIDMYMRYGSMTKEDATKKVTVLSFVKEHPECEGISYAAVSAYTEYCEPQGIDVSVFYDVWKYESSVEGDKDKNGKPISGSKKAKVLKYIHSLGLSKKQKDSLYYAFGWAKSTINEAPWR